MPRTKAVIVYSPGQARMRHLVVPTARTPDDWDERGHQAHVRNLAPGEAAVVVPLALCRQIGPEAVLARVLGRAAAGDDHAVVDARGVVVGTVKADLAIDRQHHADGHTLYPDPGRTAVHGKGWFNR